MTAAAAAAPPRALLKTALFAPSPSLSPSSRSVSVGEGYCETEQGELEAPELVISEREPLDVSSITPDTALLEPPSCWRRHET